MNEPQSTEESWLRKAGQTCRSVYELVFSPDFRTVNSAAILGLASMIFCCGPCMLLRSCTSTVQTRPLSSEELNSLVNLDVKPPRSEAKPTKNYNLKIEDFTPEEKILAENLTVADCKTISIKTKMRSLEYIAAKAHPDDSPSSRNYRVIWYSVSLEEACKHRQAYGVYVHIACTVWDEEIAREFAKQFQFP